MRPENTILGDLKETGTLSTGAPKIVGNEAQREAAGTKDETRPPEGGAP